MKKHLEKPIKDLKQQGKSHREIQQILKCSFSTISYHLYPKSKESTKKRAIKRLESGQKKLDREKYFSNPHNILSQKISQFHRLGNRKHKFSETRNFTTQQLSKIVDTNPKCYLSGEELDFKSTTGYSLDHIIPVSKGGESTISNLGFCSWSINKAKNDKTPEEFVALCQKVVTHNNNQKFVFENGQGI